MSSIFSASINQLLERVYRSYTPEPAAREGGGKDFAKLIGDLDKPNQSRDLALNIPQDLGEVCELPAFGPEVLTNLTLGEKGSAHHFQPVAYSTTISANQTALPVAALTPVSIPSSDTSVKALTSPRTELAAPPSAPELLTAKRVRIDSYEKVANAESSKKPTKVEELTAIINKAGASHSIDPALSLAVAKAESALQVYAVSQDGHASKGLFQLLDSTGREMMQRLGRKDEYRPFDPKQNSELGVAYLNRLHNLFGKESNLGYNIRTVPARNAENLEKLAVAAFNAGEGRVAKAQARAKSLGKDPAEYSAIEPHLPPSTRVYVRRVLDIRLTLNGSAKVNESV